jgi:hypothetical protein
MSLSKKYLLGQLLRGYGSQNARVPCDETVCWVEDAPVSGGQFCQKRERCITKQPYWWHGADVIYIVEAVPFRDVRSTIFAVVTLRDPRGTLRAPLDHPYQPESTNGTP